MRMFSQCLCLFKFGVGQSVYMSRPPWLAKLGKISLQNIALFSGTGSSDKLGFLSGQLSVFGIGLWEAMVCQ